MQWHPQDDQLDRRIVIRCTKEAYWKAQERGRLIPTPHGTWDARYEELVHVEITDWGRP